MKLYKYILAASVMAVSTQAMAQELNSAYFTQDYKYRHDMNPAFGNDQGYVAIPVLGNLNVRTQGNFGLGDLLFKNPTTGKYDRTFMHPDVSVDEALKGFHSGANKFNLDLRLTLISVGFKGFGGYNTIEVNERTMVGMSMPYDFFRFAKDLSNNVYDFSDLDMHAHSFAEVAFGHSRSINDKLRVGAKVKALVGVGRADFSMDNVHAELLPNAQQWRITADAKADVMVKGFQFKSKNSDFKTKSGSYEHIDDVDVDGGGVGGFGFAVDLGATYKVLDELTVSAALTDLGFINWSEHVTAVNPNKEFIFNGFQDMSVNDDGNGDTFDDRLDEYGDQLAEFANLRDTGEKGSKTTGVGATARLGVEYELPMYRKMSFGFLGTRRFNGDFSWTEGRLSANWKPLKWLDGGVNVAVSDFGTSAGWILNIHPVGANIFIGMDHIMGKLAKQGVPLKSNMNINLGMNVAF